MFPTDVIYIEGKPTEGKVYDMLMRMKDRDKLMADFIIDKMDKMKKSNPEQKALVIMNYRHAYKKPVPNSSDNTGIFLEEKYPGKVANIFINNYITTDKKPLQDGKWDAAFQLLGINDTGFNLDGSPFGKDNFDHWAFENDNTYKTMFDGFVFYQPIEEFKLGVGVPGFMEDGFFEQAVMQQEMYNKVLFTYQKKEIPPVDKEWLKKLNDIQINSVPHLTEMKEAIEKWLK
ncbi:MAG: hypothetical protein LIO93_01000 [Bacteroidales bacterium]|nr:hypothetical protein [Bacteroidales bacterium]